MHAAAGTHEAGAFFSKSTTIAHVVTRCAFPCARTCSPHAQWAKRVGTFIRTMRVVLGDRSLRTHGWWGGSVVDSVVGVFLTQVRA